MEYQPYPIVLVVIAAAVIGLPFVFFLTRLIFKGFLGEHWRLWYVRRAVESGVGGFILLSILTPFAGLEDLRNIDLALHLRPCTAGSKSTLCRQGIEGSDQLKRLQQLNWFIEHFIQFTLLPPLILGFAGSSFDRRSQKSAEPQSAKIPNNS